MFYREPFAMQRTAQPAVCTPHVDSSDCRMSHIQQKMQMQRPLLNFFSNIMLVPSNACMHAFCSSKKTFYKRQSPSGIQHLHIIQL